MVGYRDIQDAWFFVCKRCVSDGVEYEIKHGSMVGHKRRQLPMMAFYINHPEIRPLSVTLLNTAYSTESQIEDYFTGYIMSTEKAKDEQYTYGERIQPHINRIVEILKSGNGNQASLSVAKPEDVYLEHPPCLRELSWKNIDGTLQLSSYWRSWDLCNGLPVNLGGLQLLNEYVAQELGVQAGKLVCYSDGAHLYDYCYEVFE